MFGVFDGHGGGEVARYSKRHFEDGLKQLPEFEQKNYQEALRLGFLGVDVKLTQGGGLEEVAKDKRENPPNKS